MRSGFEDTKGLEFGTDANASLVSIEPIHRHLPVHLQEEYWCCHLQPHDGPKAREDVFNGSPTAIQD